MLGTRSVNPPRATAALEELRREAALLGRQQEEGARRGGGGEQALDRAGIEARAREPARLVLGEPRVADLVQFRPDRVARAPKVGEPGLGAPVPREQIGRASCRERV